MENKELYKTLRNFTSAQNKALIERIVSEISSDNEPYENKARALADAYVNDDADGVLIALCGWEMQSLVEFVERETEE